MSKKKVVIVVPVSNRAGLTSSEEQSLKHLKKHLGNHDIFIVAPEGLDVEFPGLAIKRFSPQYFGSVENYQRMVMSSGSPSQSMSPGTSVSVEATVSCCTEKTTPSEP